MWQFSRYLWAGGAAAGEDLPQPAGRGAGAAYSLQDGDAGDGDGDGEDDGDDDDDAYDDDDADGDDDGDDDDDDDQSFGWQSHKENNLFIYQARESSLVPVGFLTAQFLQILGFCFDGGNRVIFFYCFPGKNGMCREA